MPLNALRSSLPRLDAGGGHVDEALEKVSSCPSPGAGMPETFPNFVCLPIVAMIEQIYAVQVRAACIPMAWVRGRRMLRLTAKTMSGRIRHRVRETLRYIAIWRELFVRHQTWYLAWLQSTIHGHLPFIQVNQRGLCFSCQQTSAQNSQGTSNTRRHRNILLQSLVDETNDTEVVRNYGKYRPEDHRRSYQHTTLDRAKY